MSTSSSSAWREQGIAAARAQERDRARVALEKAVALDPQDEQAWLWLAAVQSDPRQAAISLENVLRINPQQPRARAGLEALRAEIARLEPPPPPPRPVPPPPSSPPAANTAPPWLTGLASDTHAPPAPAQQFTLPPLDTDITVEELVRLGMVTAKAGRRAEARQALLAAVERDEHNETAWFWLSTVVDDDEDQQIALENVLALNPYHSTALQALDEVRARRRTAPRPIAVPRPPASGEGGTPPGGSSAAPWAQPPASPPPSTPAPSPSRHPTNGLGTDPRLSERLGTGNLAGATPRHPPAAAEAAEAPGGRERSPRAPAEVRVGTGYEHMIGQVLGKRYRVLSLFSQGASTVLLASDIKRNALVLLRPETDPLSVARRGAVKSGFTQNGTAFYVSSISIGGLHLRHFIGTVGTLPTQQVVDYGLRLCAAAKKHPNLLAARYWSPETIKVDDQGRIQMAAEADAGDATPRPGPFSPPEHTAGGPLDARSDVYLIGAILFFLATGATPPAAERIPDPTPVLNAKNQLVRGQVEARFPHYPQLDPRLGGVLATALQRDPADRYPTVERMAEALRNLAENAKGRGQGANAAVMEGVGGGRGGGEASRRGVSALFWLMLALGVMIGAALLVFYLAQLAKSTSIGGLSGAPPTLTEQPSLPIVIGGGGEIGGTPTLNALLVGPTPNLAGPQPLPTGGNPAPLFTPNPAFAYPTPGNLAQLVITQVDTHRYPAISVYCNVLSPDGHPLVNLRPENFQLTNDGAVVPDLALTDLSVQPEAISTYLLLDTSGSMAGDPINRAKDSIAQFVDLSTPGDSFGIYGFNDRPYLVRDLTVSRNDLKDHLDGLVAKGGTALWDTVITATLRIRKEAGRRAIILLSDGGDTSSKATQSSALIQAQHTGVPIFVVGLRSPDFDPQALQAVAQQTGGALLVASKPDDLPGFYQQLAYRFAAQYKLTFSVLGTADTAAHGITLSASLGDQSANDARPYYEK